MPKETVMNVAQFLEYLRDSAATSDLAAGLTEVLMLRRRLELTPVRIAENAHGRIAS